MVSDMEKKDVEAVAGDELATDVKEFTEKINTLVEVLEKEQELKTQELELKQEETQKILEIQEETSTDYIELLQNQNDLISTLIMNDEILFEKLDQQNNIYVESSYMLTLAVLVGLAVKILIEQISKW